MAIGGGQLSLRTITFETALWLLYGVLFLLFRFTDDSDAKVALISDLRYGVCWRRSKQLFRVNNPYVMLRTLTVLNLRVVEKSKSQF